MPAREALAGVLVPRFGGVAVGDSRRLRRGTGAQIRKRLLMEPSKADAVRSVLVFQWNPIGFPVPNDEYDDYIPDLLRMLSDDASVPEIERKLQELEALIGVETGRSHRTNIAEVLKYLRQ